MNIKSNPPLTILSIIFGMLIIYFFLRYELILNTIIILAIIGVFSIKFSKFIEIYWIKISIFLSYIIPNLILIGLYYFILTPLSFLSKLFNSKSQFKSINSEKTIFESRKNSFSKKSFERAW